MSVESPLISVLVPVYNVGDYLARSLDSILGQSLRDIEVVCVDDGSTDSSRDILDRYAARDKRIRVVCHPCNQGLMAARASAYRIARGRYFFFCDSDDVMVAGALERLYSEAQKAGADIVAADVVRVRDGVYGYRETRHREVGNSGRSYMRAILDRTFCSLYGVLFRRDLFEGGAYSVLKHQNMSEDRILLTEILVKHPDARVAGCDMVCYEYHYNPTSLTNRARTWEYQSEYFRSLIISYDYVMAEAPEYAAAYRRFMTIYLGYCIERGFDQSRLLTLHPDFPGMLTWRSMRREAGLLRALHFRASMSSGLWRRFAAVLHRLRGHL